MAEVKAGRIVLPDLVQNLTFHVSGEEKLKTVGRALNDIANGTKANEYISDQETMVRRLIDSYEQFERIQSRSSAGELIKSFNALKAVTNEIDLSKIVQNFEKVDAAYQKASADFGKDFTGFSVDRFRDVAEAMAELAHHGVDVDKVFGRLGQSSNVGKLHEQINELQNTVGRLSKELNNVTRQRDELLSGDEIQRLKELESNFEDITGRMANEFRSFLVANDLDSDDAAWGKYYEYFESIRNGSMTAKEAIANVREELAEMIRQAEPGDTIFKSSQMEEFISKMNIACETIEYMRAEIEDLSNKISLRAVAQEMGESAKLTEEQRQAMHGLVEEGTGLNNLSQILVALVQNFDTTDEHVHTSVNSFQELLKVLDSIAHVEPANMSGFNDVLKNLRMITEFDIDSKKMKDLEESLTSLSKIPNLSNIALLGSVDLRGFNDLKASKASLLNLSTYLPELSQNVNVEKLQALSGISLANFSSENLKVSKASMDHLRELIKTINGTQDANAAGAGTTAESKLDDVIDRTTQKLRQENDVLREEKRGLQEHETSVESAAKAEEDKKKIAELLAEALKREQEETERSTKAADEHTKVVQRLIELRGQIGRLETEQAGLKFEDPKRYEEIGRQIELLTQEYNDLYNAHRGSFTADDIDRIAQATIDATDRVTKKQSEAADTATKTADAQAAAAKKAADAQEASARKQQDAIAATAAKARESADAYKYVLEKYENQIANLRVEKPVDLTAAIARMKSSLAVMTSSVTTDLDKSQAYKDWASDLTRVKDILAAIAPANRAAVQEQKDLSKSADECAEKYKKLNDQIKELKDPKSVDTKSLEKIKQLLDVIQNESVDTGIKQTALTELKGLLDSTTESVNRLAAAEREQANAEKERTNAADENRAAAESLDALINKYDALHKSTDVVTQKMDALKAATEKLMNTPSGTEERKLATEEYSKALKEATDAVNERQRAENQYLPKLKQINTLISQCEAAQRKYAAAAKLGVGKEDYERIQKASQDLQVLKDKLVAAGGVTPEVAAEFNRLSQEVSNTSLALKTNTNLIGRWATTGMQQLKSRLTYSFGLAAMVYKAVNEIKKMVSTAVELDTAMNQLQIVTRSSGAEMDTYAKRVSSMAKETAQATKDLIDATTVYARLGYSMDESASLAKYTAMLQGVGNIEASAAQDAMTAILKAFNKNVEDVEDIMNKMVVVGNNFPISVSQIAEGMNNAGSMLAVAGNTLEESIALLTASNATVQNISKASTGLRTIAARIRKTTTEEDDGEAINEAKYEEMLNILTKHQVTLTDINGEYRSTYDVLKDIAAVWDDLTSMEQAAVTEQLAGTRQQNIFSSVITQFKDAEGAMERMTDSAGELEEAYGIYLDSIQAHVNQLKAAYDELARDFVNSGLAKFIIDAATGIISVLDKLVNKIGAVGTIAAGAGITLLIANFGKIKTAILGIVEAQAAMNASMAASGGMAWLAGGTLSPIIPILLGIAAAIAATAVGIKKWRDAHPTLEQLKKDAKNTKDEFNQLSDTIKTNSDRIQELYEIKEENGGLTEKEQDELELLRKQNEQLEQQKQLLQQIMEYKNAKVVSKAGSDTLGFFNNSERETLIGIGAAEGNIYQKNTSGYGGLLNALSDYAAAEEKIKSIQEQIKKARLDGTEESARAAEKLMEQLSEAQGEAAQYAEDVAEFQQWLIERREDLAGATDEQSIEALHQIDDALRMIGKTTGKDKKYLEDFKKDLDKLSGDTLKKLLNGLELTSDEVRELMKWMDEMGYSVEDAAKFFNEYCNEIRDASKAQEELDPGKSIGDLTSLQDELSETTEALEAYKKAMEGGEKGDAVKEMADIYKGALEDLKSGRVDSRRVHNAAELFFSQEQLAEMDYDMAEIGRRMQNSMLEALFDPSGESEQSYGQRFAKYIENNASKFAKAGAAVEKTAEGYRFHYDSLQQLADAFGISREACSAFLDDLDAYGVEVMRSTEENIELSNKFVDIQKTAGGAREAVVEFIKQLSEAGRDSMEIREILADLSRDGVIQLSDEEVKKILQETMEGLSDVDSTKASPEVTVDADGAFNTFRTIEAWINYLNRQRIQIEVDASGTTKVGTATSVPSASKNADTARTSRAAGGVTGKAGPTLVNELGPELISDRGRAFIANNGEPGFVNLSKDAIVFTAEETKEIAKKSGLVSGAHAYADGTRKGLIGRLLGGSDVPARANTWVCKICGSRNDPSATRCWKCKNVKGASNTAAATAYQKATQTTSGTSSSSSSSSSSWGAKWTCNICGASNGATYSTCWDCGFPRGAQKETYQPSQLSTYETSYTPSSVWTCKICGSNNDGSASKCWYCKNAKGATNTAAATAVQKAREQAIEEQSKSLYSNKSTATQNKAPQSLNYDSLFSYGSSGAGGGTGGGGVGGADSQSKSNPQKIDWIAVRLNRIQRAISDLDVVASSGLKNLSTRIDSAKKEVTELNKEIDASNQGYNRYIQEANSVGLGSDLAERVRNGTIDINSYDDDTRQKIQEYQEWWLTPSVMAT